MFFCIWFLRISSINFSYSLSLKVNWVYSLQYLFYHLLYMARAASRIWIHRLFFQCPIFGVRNNIWDQTFCVIELPLQLESRGEAHRTGFKPSQNCQNCVKLIGHGGAHKHSCALKSLSIQNTCSITNFLPTSLTTCLKSKIKNTLNVRWMKLWRNFFLHKCLLPDEIY